MTISVTDLTPKYYVLDLEVDRVPESDNAPQRCITQIGVIDPSRPADKRIFNKYIKPPKELRKPGWSERFKHIPAGQVSSFKKAWPELVDWINKGLDGNRQAVIVMHNGFEHDWPILKTEVARCITKTNVAIPKFWKPFDTYWLKNALHMQGDGSVTALCHKFGIEVLDAHDAVNDVKMTDEIFKKMIGNAPMDAVLVAALDQDHPVRKVASVVQQYVEADFAVYDFEATGLFPRTGEFGQNPRAVQLAVYLPSVDKCFDEKINPGMPIPRESAAVHHIYDEDVVNSLDFKAVWLQSEDFIQTNIGCTANKIVVYLGHNIWGYDNKLYKAECERTGLKPKWLKSLDTLALVRSIFKGIKGIPRRGFFKQEYLTPLLGIDVIDAHDAKGDVMVCWKFFEKLIDGVSPQEVSQAVLSKHPVLGLAQLCKDKGRFDAHYYWELYQKASGLTLDLAKRLFNKASLDEAFFTTSNLAALLNINIHPNDKELYIHWRIFLKLTEGIKRATVNAALDETDPIDALLKLCADNDEFNPVECLTLSHKAIQCTVDLAKNMYPGNPEEFYQPHQLARMLKLEMSRNGDNPFDVKRIFLELTKGVDERDIKEALNKEDTVERLGDLARTRGTLLPVPITPTVHAIASTQKDDTEMKFSSFNHFYTTGNKRRYEGHGNSPVRKKQKRE